MRPCGGYALTGQPRSAKTTSVSAEPKPVGQRVDYLQTSIEVGVETTVAGSLAQATELAEAFGSAPVQVGDFSFELRRSPLRDLVVFRNADCHCVLSHANKLVVTVGAPYLATHPLECCVALGTEIATAFGTVVDTTLGRFDLAVDFVQFPLLLGDFERFCTQRARVHNFVTTESKDTDDCDELPMVAHRRHRLTGFTIAPGNTIMARLYDKSAELQLSGREEKRVIEPAIWCANGYDGISPVTRVESQLRGEILSQMGLRNPSDLPCKVDGAWQYFSREWLRLVDLASATRKSRCKNDPRWDAVAAINFYHSSEPIRRICSRGGASAELVVGAVHSRLASTRQIAPISLVTQSGRTASDEVQFALSMTDSQATEYMASLLRDDFLTAAVDAGAVLLIHSSPQRALARLLVQRQAKIARFTSIDDLKQVANEAAE